MSTKCRWSCRVARAQLSVLLKLWHDMESDRELKLEQKQREDKSKSYIASVDIPPLFSLPFPSADRLAVCV